jgi:hypothetical protein
MDFRCLPLLALAFTSALSAQVVQPDAKGQQPDPAKKEPQPVAATEQKPAPRELTQGEQKAKLEAEIERLQKEIAFVTARKGTIKASIAQKLAQQASTFEPKKINAGTSRAAMPPAMAMQPRKAKLVEAGEAADLGAGVLFTVNGHAVRQNDIDQLVDYQKSFPLAEGTQLPENYHVERAARELITLEAAQAAFAKEAEGAAAKAKEMAEKLQKGADFAELAKGTPALMGEQPGTVFTVTRNSPHGLFLERMAFTTKPGTNSEVFRMPLGYAILRVEKFDKGEKPLMDHAEVRLLLVPFGPSLDEVRKVQTTVGQGQLDILIKDEKTRQILPIQFR